MARTFGIVAVLLMALSLPQQADGLINQSGKKRGGMTPGKMMIRVKACTGMQPGNVSRRANNDSYFDFLGKVSTSNIVLCILEPSRLAKHQSGVAY